MKQRNEAEKINQKAEKLLEEGTPEEIFDHPKHERLKEFLAKVL